MNIPNTLTLARIAMIPVLVIVYYLPFSWSNLVACILFTLAAITDLLDGYLARRLDQTSTLGAFLDPVADKLMVAVVLVILVQQDPRLLLAVPAAVIIGREITISALREWMAELGARSKVAVSIFGKIKTVTQMISLGMLIYENPFYGIPIYATGLVLLYVAVILTLWSMFEYLYSAWPKLSESLKKQ